MICKNCSAEVNEGSAFCQNCGYAVNSFVSPTVPSNPQNSSTETVLNGDAVFSEAQPIPPQSNQELPNDPNFMANQTNPTYIPPNIQNTQFIPPVQPQSDPKGFAIAALVLGIVSLVTELCCCGGFIPAVLAIIFGILGKKSSKSSMATAGLVMGIISVVFSVIGVIVSVIFSVFGIDAEIESFFNDFFSGGSFYF